MYIHVIIIINARNLYNTKEADFAYGPVDIHFFAPVNDLFFWVGRGLLCGERVEEKVVRNQVSPPPPIHSSQPSQPSIYMWWHEL